MRRGSNYQVQLWSCAPVPKQVPLLSAAAALCLVLSRSIAANTTSSPPLPSLSQGVRVGTMLQNQAPILTGFPDMSAPSSFIEVKFDRHSYRALDVHAPHRRMLIDRSESTYERNGCIDKALPGHLGQLRRI